MNDKHRFKNLRWSVERRLEFVEFRLFWNGKVNRTDLVDFFGISVPQASADLGRYQEIANQNLVYDRRVKSYLATQEFKPVLQEFDVNTYLEQLRINSKGMIPREKSLVGWAPQYETVPEIMRRVDPEKLRIILDAIRTKSAIHVKYQSISRPNPLWRWLTPHALAFDGSRLHMRAWCDLRRQFLDFVFARITSLGETKPTKINADCDVEWQSFLTFRIGPNPNLSEAARRAIELDYGMDQGEIAVQTRIGISFYLERSLGLDFDLENVSPKSQQIVLLNREEVEKARNRAKQKTARLISKFLERLEKL